MCMTGKIIALIGMSLAVETVSTTAFAFSKHTLAVADSGVQRLLRLMDKDLNGTVSKEEFLQFMLQRFEALDVNGNGRLEPNEMRPMNLPNWIVRASPTKPTKAVR